MAWYCTEQDGGAEIRASSTFDSPWHWKQGWKFASQSWSRLNFFPHTCTQLNWTEWSWKTRMSASNAFMQESRAQWYNDACIYYILCTYRHNGKSASYSAWGDATLRTILSFHQIPLFIRITVLSWMLTSGFVLCLQIAVTPLYHTSCNFVLKNDTYNYHCYYYHFYPISKVWV